MEQVLGRAVLTAAGSKAGVIIVGATRASTRKMFDDICHTTQQTGVAADAITSVRSASGSECIHFRSGGRIGFFTGAFGQLRGRAADLAVVEPAVLVSRAALADVLLVLATSESAELWVTSGQVDLLAATQASLHLTASPTPGG